MTTTFLKAKSLTLSTLMIWAAGAMSATKDNLEGYIGGMSNQLNRDIGDVPGNRFHGDLRFSYYNESPKPLEMKFDFSARANDQGLIMYSLQEAFFGLKADTVQGRAGRQVLDWAPIDATWGLGKLNNRRNFDFFEPGQEGLVGLSFGAKANSGLFFQLFLSRIYVPESNPSLDIDDKKKTIRSRNPWARPPARSTEISGQTTPIEYDVDYPEIKDVVFRYSAGANIGLETEHFVTNLYFIRKPENQISTQVEIALSGGADVVKANITPEFYYHDVFGGNIKYRNSGTKAYVSGVAAYPNTFPDGNEEATVYTELKTEKIREAYLGTGISKTKDLYSFGINYIARVSPYDREDDSLATDPRWNQAVNGFVTRSFGRLKLLADIKYDMLSTDRLVMIRGGYNLSENLLVTLGVNMIGTPNNGKSFWSPYTNNDALFAGLRYIF